MAEKGETYTEHHRPPWGFIAVLLVLGVAFVSFGNADRIFWRITSHGAKLPGVVVDVRAYRQPENTYLTYVPKVAFRDPAGAIRIMETRNGSIHYDFENDQPVMVLWRKNSETIAIDLPFQRKLGTSIIMWLSLIHI